MVRKNLGEIEETLYDRHHYSSEDLAQIMPKLREIDELREEKNAIILAHYYQIPPIQLIADFRGDSLQLAQAAKKIEDKNLVVCSTVVFMAEMVKLLSPSKKVVVPNLEAGCSIAEGINGEAIRKIRERFPDAGIVSYVNTYADTKAEVDVICTSANAEEIVRKVSNRKIILLPDYFFATNVFNNVRMEMKGRECLAYKGKVGNELVLEDVFSGSEYRIGTGEILPILDKGTCIVHEQFTPEEVRHIRRMNRIEVVMSHPEVSKEVAKISDFVGGTGKMIEHVAKNPNTKRYLVISECDLTAPLIEKFPDREFFTPCKLCPYMKRNSLNDLTDSLREEIYEIKLDERTAEGARRSLERMFELTA